MTNTHAPSPGRLVGGRRNRAALIAAFVVATTASPAHSQADTSGWKFELTPYLWAAGMSGSVSVSDRPQAGLAVEQSFSDILSVLQFALMGSFEARKGRWGAFTDGVYFKVNDEGTLTGKRGFVSLSATAGLAQQMYSLAGSYRVGQGKSPIDVFAGARYASVGWDVDIAVSSPAVIATEQVFKETKSWVDPYIGARVQTPLGTRWALGAYADVGGFGIASDLVTQAMATVRFAFTPGIVGNLGFRVVTDDYDKDGFKYDMMNGGAVLGVAFRW